MSSLGIMNVPIIDSFGGDHLSTPSTSHQHRHQPDQDEQQQSQSQTLGSQEQRQTQGTMAEQLVSPLSHSFNVGIGKN